MAAPSYNTDLIDITTAENITNWTALGGGASGLAAETDFFIQGSFCISKQVSAALKGMVFNNGSTITPGTNTHFFVWMYSTTPGLLDTLANGGMRVTIGTSTTAYVDYHVKGSAEYIYGGWLCFPIRYVTTSSGTAPYRTVTGSPGANPQYFGGQIKTTATIHGTNLGVDAIRYGTGIYITSGDSGTPATFAGAAAQNDSSSNRWGILKAVAGGYNLKGRFVIGQNTSLTATAAYFSDSNTLVTIDDTPHTLTDFTQLIIDHASTTFNISGVTLLALGTNNPGKLVFNNSSTTSSLSTCTFDSIGTSTLQAGVTVDSCTWRNTDLVTQNSSTIADSSFDTLKSSASILSNNPSLITGCTFISDGSNHALQITATGSFSLDSLTFINYATSDGSTGNEVIYNNSGGAVTLNITNCVGTISVRNGTSASTTLVSGVVSTTVTVQDVNGSSIQNARVLLTAFSGGALPYNASVTITRSGTTATVSHTSHGMQTNDQVMIKGANQQDYNDVHTITRIDANSYSYTVANSPTTPATGTIQATFVALFGLTDVNGQITMSRSFSSNQPVTGRVRKSTSSPYYKTGQISGTIDSTVGFSATILMVSDE